MDVVGAGAERVIMTVKSESQLRAYLYRSCFYHCYSVLKCYFIKVSNMTLILQLSIVVSR